MGTISDKLTYLNDTKTKIRDGINAIGGSLDSDDTFRSYADELDNLYNEMPKVSASNVQQATLNNTKQAKMKVNLKGNTSQDSTTGKNKIDFKTISYTSASSATVTRDGEEYTVVNSTSRWGGCRFSQSNLQLETNTTYTFSALVKSTNSTDGAYLYVYGGINNTGSNISGPKAKNGERCYVTFTTPVEFLGGTQQIALLPGEVEKSAVFTNIMIEKSSTMTDYEPYTNGPAPNPDFPMDIHVVSGDNTIEICGKNLYSRDNGKYNVPVYATDGTSASYQDVNVVWIKVNPNTDYSFTLQPNAQTFYVRIIQCDGNKGFISRDSTNYTSYTSTARTLTKTTSANCEWLQIAVNQYATAQISQNNWELMIEQSSTATTYQAYTGQSQLISLGVENLIDSSLLTTSGSYNVSSIDNGVVTSNTITGYTGVRIALGQSINLKTNDIVYVRLKLKSDNAGYIFNTIQLMTSSNTKISVTEDKLQTPTLTTNYQEYIMKYKIGEDTTLNKIFIQHKGNSSDTFTIKDIQFSYANGQYTPYGTTPIELCKIGTYQDYIYKEDDKWYLHKEIGKYTFDGTENWNDDGGTQGTDYRHNINRGRFTTPQPIGINGTYISNYFTKHTMNNDVGEFGDFYCNQNWFVFLDKSKTYDLDGWKTWLSTHNTIVYYVLATPTNTEITDNLLINQLNTILYSYNGQTNVSQSNNDEAFILDVSALLDANTYIDHLEAQVEALS